MTPYNRGTAILVEVEYKRQTPFGSLSHFDPTTPKITITDPANVAVVTDAALTMSTTGKYYYICQTATTWASGQYRATVTGVDGSYTGLNISRPAFELE